MCVTCYHETCFNECENQNNGTDVLTVLQMRTSLSNMNKDAPLDSTLHKVEEIYHAALASHESSIHLSEFKKVRLQLLPPSAIYSLPSVTRIKLINGRSFISNKAEVANNMIIPLISLLASLVTFDGLTKYTTFDHLIYTVLPTMFVRFAHESRVDSRFCLLIRYIRHSLDPQTPPIIKSTISVFRHDNDYGIVIRSPIPASMKNETYTIEVAVTKNVIVSCACNCQCGGDKREERGAVCVHVLTILNLLSIILNEGFAQYLLIDLSNQWDVNGQIPKKT